MRTRTFTMLVVAIVALAGWYRAFAHDPVEHGFTLVTFDPPFVAPAFSLPRLGGEPTALTDMRGKVVLLNFWATWCPPCLKEMPAMEASFQRYRKHDFTILAVSSDQEGADIVREFTDKLGVTFPVLLDTDQRVSTLYGAKNLPVSFIVDRQGRIVAGSQGARDWASPEAISTLDELLGVSTP